MVGLSLSETASLRCFEEPSVVDGVEYTDDNDRGNDDENNGDDDFDLDGKATRTSIRAAVTTA
ncbi:hypothetical protein KAW53_03925 [Candidatus Bathyarchaeota archaeon]|nr:hypothetical protein [Candidatus Bathyarchaeota archaeon]